MVRNHLLLPLAIAAFVLLLPATASAATIQVDITPDNSTDDGFCTLREAITATSTNADVNGTDATADCDHDGGTGLDTITFGAGFVGNPAQAITLGTVLPDITGSLAIEAAAGPNCPAAPDPCVEVQGVAGSSVLIFNNAPNSSVRGLALTNGSNGINVIGTSTGFKLTQSWIGIKLDESSDPNTTNGVTFGPTADGGDIGGTASADRNVFYANPTNLNLGNGDAHLVRGNWLGVLPDATAGSAAPVDNIRVGTGGADNTIGADDAGTPGVCDFGCNVVSRATGNGIDTDPNATLRLAVRGNFIGLDPGGTQDFGNNVGVELDNADSSTVGGATAASRNYIGGNNSRGVEIGATADDATVRNNFIGLAASGAAAVPDNTSGVQALAADGDAVIADNRFGGAGSDPFQALLLSSSTTGAEVQGNVFGIGIGGEDLGDFDQHAINVFADGNTIGGDGPGEGNVIANAPNGITLFTGADSNAVLGNLIGTDGSGANAGNGTGIRIGSSTTPSTSNTIGGLTPASENVISNSSGDAIEIGFDGSDGNQILRNRGSGNAGLFIDLRDTLSIVGGPGNGFGNTVDGPNGGIQEPVVTSARRGRDRVAGTGIPGATVRVYRAQAVPAGAPTGVLKFLGAKVIGAGGAWKINPAGKLKKGWVVSANQTEPDGDSSELALAKKTRR